MAFPTPTYVTDIQTELTTIHSKTTEEAEALTNAPHCFVSLGAWENDSKTVAQAAIDLLAM
jgi:hypothetical protein